MQEQEPPIVDKFFEQFENSDSIVESEIATQMHQSITGYVNDPSEPSVSMVKKDTDKVGTLEFDKLGDEPTKIEKVDSISGDNITVKGKFYKISGEKHKTHFNAEYLDKIMKVLGVNDVNELDIRINDSEWSWPIEIHTNTEWKFAVCPYVVN